MVAGRSLAWKVLGWVLQTYALRIVGLTILFFLIFYVWPIFDLTATAVPDERRTVTGEPPTTPGEVTRATCGFEGEV